MELYNRLNSDYGVKSELIFKKMVGDTCRQEKWEEEFNKFYEENESDIETYLQCKDALNAILDEVEAPYVPTEAAQESLFILMDQVYDLIDAHEDRRPKK